MDNFSCQVCGRIFQKEWNNKDAIKEYERKFKKPFKKEEVTLLCDSCYKKVLAKLN